MNHRDTDARDSEAWLIRQYLADGLDPVELRAFKRRVDTDPGFAERVDDAWEAAVIDRGLGVLPPGQGVWTGCLSDDTLARYAAGAVEPEDASIVEAHLACARCEGRLAVLREAHPQPVVSLADARAEPTPAGQSRRRLIRRVAGGAGPLLAVAAAVGLVVLLPTLQPEDPRLTARGTAEWAAGVRVEPFTEQTGERVVIAPGATYDLPLVLGIDYVNRRAEPVYFAAVLVDARGEAYWLVPEAPGERPVPLGPHSATDDRFQDLWSVDAAPGPASLRWRKSPAPFAIEGLTRDDFGSGSDPERRALELTLRAGPGD